MVTTILCIMYAVLGLAIVPTLIKYTYKEAYDYMFDTGGPFKLGSIEEYVITASALFVFWLPSSIIISIHSRMRK